MSQAKVLETWMMKADHLQVELYQMGEDFELACVADDEDGERIIALGYSAGEVDELIGILEEARDMIREASRGAQDDEEEEEESDDSP